MLRETSTTALIDRAIGHSGRSSARRAMEIAIVKARQHALGAVGLRNSAHIGRLGEYALMAVEHGMIGFVTCNSSQLTAPYGGVDRVFGTNPFAYAFPRSGQPFLMDFATSVAAEGKLRRRHVEGRAHSRRLDPGSRPKSHDQPGRLL